MKLTKKQINSNYVFDQTWQSTYKDFIEFAIRKLRIKKPTIQFVKTLKGNIVGEHYRVKNHSLIVIKPTGQSKIDLDTIAHEMTHQKQYDTEALSVDDSLGGLLVWKKELIIENLPYFTAPHEVQARRVAANIVKSYNLALIKKLHKARR